VTRYVLTLILILMVCGRGASAAPRVARVLVVGPADAPATALVRDELRAIGLVVVGPERHAPSVSLEELAEWRAADAVVRVSGDQEEMDVWVRDVGRPAFEVTVRSSETRAPNSARLLALRAVELVRGRLVEVVSTTVGAPEPGKNDVERAPRRPSPQPVRPPPAPEALEGHHRASLLIAPTLAWSPGGVPLMGHVLLEAGWWLAPRFELAVCGVLPISAASMDARGGSIAVRTLMLGAGVRVELLPTDHVLSIGLRAGVGALRGSYERTAPNPVFSGIDESEWSLLPWLGSGLGWRISPAVLLRADALLGLALPELTIDDGVTQTARFGRPAAFLALGFEAHLL
jgi:hypothetical protein